MRIPFFRIFYSTTFTVLVLLLTALLLITPGDHILQAFREAQLYNIFIVAGAHLLTLLIAAFIYAGRLYANRTVLASIPRELNLYEKGKTNSVPRRVRRLVKEGLERSAWIARVGRPRAMKATPPNRETAIAERKSSSRPTSAGKALEQQIRLGAVTETPVWGTISHPGWSSPDSTDLPNLHLPPIILELPHLIEARAVSLAPPSAITTVSSAQDSTPTGLAISDQQPEIPAPVPSALATSLLQRPATMGLREYLSHLSSLNLINPPTLNPTFLTLYERARFSGTQIIETDFRTLMSIFAEILRGMKALPPDLLQELQDAENEEEEEVAANSLLQQSDIDHVSWHHDDNYGSDGAQDDAQPRASMESTGTVAHTPQPRPPPSTSSSHISFLSTSSTTSSHALAKRGSGSIRRGLRTPSIPSIRAARSLRSKASSVFTGRSSERSVIHLVEEREALDLPFVVVDGEGGGQGESG